MKSHCSQGFVKCANALGLFFLMLFAVCFAWYFVNPVEQDLHLALLKLSFLGFEGMDAKSLLLGAVQSYVWGYIVAGLWSLSTCCMKSKGGKGDCCGGK